MTTEAQRAALRAHYATALKAVEHLIPESERAGTPAALSLALIDEHEQLRVERDEAHDELERMHSITLLADELEAERLDPGHLARVNEDLRRENVRLKNHVPGLSCELDATRWERDVLRGQIPANPPPGFVVARLVEAELLRRGLSPSHPWQASSEAWGEHHYSEPTAAIAACWVEAALRALNDLAALGTFEAAVAAAQGEGAD